MNLRTITLIIACCSIAFFALRVRSYIDRPTNGFIAYYTAGTLAASDAGMIKLYDDSTFRAIENDISHGKYQDLYRANPPTLALLFLPLSSRHIEQAKLIWEIISLLCVILSLYFIRKHYVMSSVEIWTFIALTFGWTPLYENFVWGQVYALLFLLHVLLFVFWSKKQFFFAASMIALLLALKGYGPWFLLLAMFRKEWKLLLYSAGMYCSIVVVSSLFFGMEMWLAYFGVLRTTLSATPFSLTAIQNVQSFLGWCFIRDEWHANPFFDLPRIVFPLAVLLFLGAVGLAYSIQRKSSSLEIPFMCVIIFGVLTAPLNGEYHFTFFLLVVISGYRLLSRSSTLAQRVIFGVSVFLLAAKIPYYYPIFQNSWVGIFGFPRLYGAVMMLYLLHQSVREVGSTMGALIVHEPVTT